MPKLTDLDIKKIGETKLRLTLGALVLSAVAVFGGALKYTTGISTQAGKTVQKVEMVEKRVNRNEEQIKQNQDELMKVLLTMTQAIGRLEGKIK